MIFIDFIIFLRFCNDVTTHCDRRGNQIHILRDMRPITTACPACWAIYRDKCIEIVYGEKNNILYWAD
jgi:hypothetical protein